MVDEEIRKKDFMAQTQALGRAANLGRRVVQQRRELALRQTDVWLWRLRGLLWIMTACFSLCYQTSSQFSALRSKSVLIAPDSYLGIRTQCIEKPYCAFAIVLFSIDFVDILGPYVAVGSTGANSRSPC